MATKAVNVFDPYLNECQTYVWEWYIPEQKVRFGIPSLNSLWLDDQQKNIKLSTMLERVHPDDIEKVLVRHTSPLYRSDKMFEVDIRLNVAAELMPDGQSSGQYEWYGFRGKTVRRDEKGRPTYVRGVAINLDQRYRAQMKLLAQKDRQIQQARRQVDACASVLQEVDTFIRTLAQNADTLIATDHSSEIDSESRMMYLTTLRDQVDLILEMTDKVRSSMSTSALPSEGKVRTVMLWEYLAERQQTLTLKAGRQMQFYFSNLYDTLQIKADAKLLDALLDNIVSALLRLHEAGRITISYMTRSEAKRVDICVTYEGSKATSDSVDEALLTVPTTMYGETSFGLSVNRLMARRMHGTVSLDALEGGRIRYVISLPIDATQTSHDAAPADTLEELLHDHETQQTAVQRQRDALPHVLIGVRDDMTLYENQHLFEVTMTMTTDQLQAAFEQEDPDIVFVDYNLPGNVSVSKLITQMRKARPETPIIVTDDYAKRPLHRQIRQLGANYMLTNPLSLRKVNQMIKRYLSC